MPSTVTILCQIKSKGLDGGFVNGLARYMNESKNFKIFHYGYYKKQISLFLHDLQVNDYALICGKCVFDNEDMYILISGAFKIENFNTETQLPQTGPHISFVGKVYLKPEEKDYDCIFGVYLTEYNNFNFGNKEKMTFKIQVVYDAGPNSRFRKLASKLEIGKLVHVTGFLDLNDNELPFVDAKEIDLLDESSNDQQLISKSPFSRISKFRNNKSVFIKKEEASNTNLPKVNNSKVSENEKEDEVIEESEISGNENTETSKGGKKRELMELSTQRLKKGRKKDNSEMNDNGKEIIDVEASKTPRKQPGRKKKNSNN